MRPLHDCVRPIYEDLEKHMPWEVEFLQATREVFATLGPVIEKNSQYLQALKYLVNPDRIISFRVAWMDRDGKVQINRGYRVQLSSALGPYKGGLRLHPSVNESILKFLAFEQAFKNALTTLPLGAGKGGSDFDPKGKTDAEVMSFCQSFMTELFRHIGASQDVPAGDIGVGGREIGYLFGQYKRLSGQFEGVLTGKDITFGGSLIRPEATGYGTVFFLKSMLEANKHKLKGVEVLVSGSGNVAQYAIEQLLKQGAKPITASDSGGTVVDDFDEAKLAILMKLKNEQRGRISEYPKLAGSGTYHKGVKPWSVDLSKRGKHPRVAMPCATQNEINLDDAKALKEQQHVFAVAEGANMPSTPEAMHFYQTQKTLFAPAKAANAGGVAVSGLEMSQNSQRLHWTRDEVEAKLKDIMAEVFAQCAAAAKEYGESEQDYAAGANVAGFLKLADAILKQGCV